MRNFFNNLFRALRYAFFTETETCRILCLAGIKIKFSKKKCKVKQCNRDINAAVGLYKFVHVMHNDKFTKPFVDFMNSNFNNNEHLFLCRRVNNDELTAPFPKGKNVIEIGTLNGINLYRRNIDKVVIHSLCYQEVVNFLYKHKRLLKEKAFWSIWGGDLYHAPRNRKNDYVRKNFKGYLTDSDDDVAREKYGLHGKPFYCMHGLFPISLDMINEFRQTVRKHDHIRIQVNNSCDDSTLTMLDNLAKFKDENIIITTILSYGKMEFKEAVINKGKAIFGDKFEYVDCFMPSRDYAKHLAENDILILNQDRQQGVGNIVASVALGKKVFVRGEISTFKKMHGYGVYLFNSNDISGLSFDEFIENDYVEYSQSNAEKFFDTDYKMNQWKVFFDAK